MQDLQYPLVEVHETFRKAPMRRKIASYRKFKVGSGSSLKKKSKKLIRAHKTKKKPKKFKKDLWAEFGLNQPRYIRYTGLQGVLWYVLSQYVRKTEFKEYGGKCVDQCGAEISSWEESDCGHFRSAKSLSTRFLRENLGIQRKYCNSPRGGNGNQYAFGLEIDRRYGPGTAERLTLLSKQTSKPFSKEFLRAEILKYQTLLAELK